MSGVATIPIVTAHPFGTSGTFVAFICPHCRVPHSHRTPTYGDVEHRPAHCIDRSSPYLVTGYMLHVVGDPVPDLAALIAATAAEEAADVG